MFLCIFTVNLKILLTVQGSKNLILEKMTFPCIFTAHINDKIYFPTVQGPPSLYQCITPLRCLLMKETAPEKWSAMQVRNLWLNWDATPFPRIEAQQIIIVEMNLKKKTFALCAWMGVH